MSRPLTLEEGSVLLRLARRAIARKLNRPVGEIPELPFRLREALGVFVTLRRRSDGALRGCIGYVEPRFPLAEGVAHAARAAAFDDSRFEAVRPDELDGLVIDVSVLGAPEPIDPERVQVGVHGLILRHQGRTGLLLPQVPVEQGWDRLAFLEQTCRKAGLPPGAWLKTEAELLGFSAQLFEEEQASTRAEGL
jgi:uncharacterized protein (TIGR00296 family)